MSVPGLILRFVGLYIAFLVGIAVVFNFFDTNPNFGVKIGALVGSVFVVCSLFCSKNKRPMMPNEKRNAFLGIWVADLVLQILVICIRAATNAVPPLGAIFVGITIIGLLHGAMIYFTVSIVSKRFAKQISKGT